MRLTRKSSDAVHPWCRRAARALALAALVLLGAPAALRSQEADSKPAAKSAAAPLPELSVRVRAANQPLCDRAISLIERVRAATERFASRANKPDELRGKADQLKREIVEPYRTLHQLGELADELVLRGERDGVTIRKYAELLRPPLDAAVGDLRTHLGSAQGLNNAVVRRAKDQLIPIKQLDDQIKQSVDPQKWTKAYERHTRLIEDADEVGHFVEPKEGEQIFRPLQERAAQIRPGYMIEKKAALDESLREEFAGMRPDLETLLQSLTVATREAREKREIRWNGRATPGQDCIELAIEEWTKIDRAVVQCAAVLHARGTAAEIDLKSLVVDYEAVRTRTLGLMREMILAESETLTASALESSYAAYLDSLPRLMTALHATPDDFQPAATALNQFVAKSPALATRVRAYRTATDESIKWRRRTVQQYLKAMHAPQDQKPPVEPLAKLLDRPPALPGQEGPAGLKRVNQSYWTFEQPPEFVAGIWSEHWKDIAVTLPSQRVLWATGADPRFVSPWHRRTCIEFDFPRQQLVALSDSLAKDMLVGPNRPPLTLEAALALESALRGPYIELGGTITNARVESLSDRLADSAEPLDIAGSLRPDALVAFPSLAASVRLQVKPAWFAHDLFFWSSSPAPTQPPATSSPDKPPGDRTIAAQPSGDAPPAKSNDTLPPPSKDADAANTPSAKSPTLTPQQAAGGAQQPGDATKKLEPAKPPPSVPKGGVKF